MKQIFTILIITLSFQNSYSQFFNYFEDYFNLEVEIDTTQNNNIWQIGPPSKTIFNEPFSAPNVMITDTIMDYPIANQSTFTVNIKEFNAQPLWWYYPYMIMMFWHKMDVDSDHAGGWIEASYDGGITWDNIYTDSVYQVVVIDFDPRDTLFNGEIGFASNFNDEWRLSTICWGALDYLPALPPEPDSIMLRFHFTSDSIAMPGEGWMIDNLEVYPEIIHTVEDLRNMGVGESLIMYPNPMDEALNLFYKIETPSRMVFQIYDLTGRLIYQKDYGKIPKGIFEESIPLGQIPNLPPAFIVSLELEGRRLVKKAMRKVK